MSHLAALVCRLILLAAVCVAAGAVAIVTLRFPGIVVIVIVLVVKARMNRWRLSGNFGTAAYCDLMGLLRRGWLGNAGFFAGTAQSAAPPKLSEAAVLLIAPAVPSHIACRIFLASLQGGRWCRDLPVRIPDCTHTLTVAPTGRGKGIYVIVPNALSSPNVSRTWGTVYVDRKDGELYKLTADARRRFGPVIRLDGFGMFGPGSANFNIFSLLDPNADDFHDRCLDFASMNNGEPEKGTDVTRHFAQMAEITLASVIALVACDPNPEKRNLQTVRDIISDPDKFGTTVEIMPTQPLLRRQGKQLKWPKEREMGSIMSTLTRMTSWLDSAAMVAHTSGVGGFDPLVLREKRGTTVYVCTPSHRTNAEPYVRLVLGTIIRRLAENGGDERRKVSIVVDEAVSLGPIKALDHAITTVRGAGLSVHLIVQGFSQLRDCYGPDRAATIIGNCDTLQVFGVNSIEDAELLSKRAGDEQVLNLSLNDSYSHSRPDGPYKDPQPGTIQRSRSRTTSEHGKPLIRPDEFTRAPDQFSIVWHKAGFPAPIRLERYYDSPLFKNDRAGRPRGVGLGALATAMALLIVSGIAAFAALNFAAAPPVMAPVPPRPSALPRQPLPYGGGFGPPPYSPAPWPGYVPSRPYPHRSPLMRLPYPPEQGGRLIRIQ